MKFITKLVFPFFFERQRNFYVKCTILTGQHKIHVVEMKESL